MDILKRNKNYFKNIFSSSKHSFDTSIKKTSKTKKNSVNEVKGKGVFKNSDNIEFQSDYYRTKEAERTNKDIKDVQEARHVDGYISRPLWNLEHSMVADDFEFYIKNKNDPNLKSKINKMEQYFLSILKDSGYIQATFFDELAHNIHYSNIFIHKRNDYLQNKTLALTIMPSIKWVPIKKRGLTVTKWRFTPDKNSSIFFNNGNKEFNSRNIIHLTLNKETGDNLGIPLMKAPIDDTALLRELENADASNYVDAVQKNPYITIGDEEKGSTEEEITTVKQYFNTLEPDDIPIVSGRVKINNNGIERIEGTDIRTALKDRVIASTGSSKTAMGESSAGRQSAEADSTGEDKAVSSLQTKLANQLNEKLFMLLNQELFGDKILENEMVLIRAKKNLDIREREEKHNLLLWQSGGIDKETYEERMGFKLNDKKIYQALINSSPTNSSGQVAQKSDPANQYGKRGSSKKSKKD